MSEGTPKAIEPKGIVRNATKIGVQDGQAEDLINLRFVDGSWRASGDGRLVHTMSGTIYQQLYVHTNVYHHLLGVNNGKLYWFANIENDGTTFTPLAERKELTSVTGDVWITQTGHLLTVIDETDDFEYFIFKLGDQEYAKVITDANGKPDSRKVFPYGNVHFNFQADWYGGDFNLYDDNQYVVLDDEDINFRDSPSCVPKVDPPAESTTHAAAQIWHAKMLEAFKMATDYNCFTGPFLALIAVRLYDGSYIYASNPVLINPREKLSMDDELTYSPRGYYIENNTLKTGYICLADGGTTHPKQLPVFSSGTSAYNNGTGTGSNFWARMMVKVTGHNLLLSIDDLSILKNNKEVFTGIGVFITRQSSLFYMGASDYLKGRVLCKSFKESIIVSGQDNTQTYLLGHVSYSPGRRTKSEVITDLINSPFYLLRDYTLDELNGLKENCLVDIRSDAKYKGVLSNITSQKTLQTESTSRATYLPKVSYLYNGRVHIANYKTYPFFGFPIDSFHLHNHSLWPRDGQWWNNTLYNLVESYDIYFQYHHDKLSIQTVNALIKAGAPYYVIRVVIESQQGEQEVVRYLPAYNTSAAPAHTANFIEDLNPILCYPDARAKRMKISYVRQVYGTYCEVGRKDYPLKPHPYLNIAYYIDPDLKPIKVNQYYDTVYVDF